MRHLKQIRQDSRRLEGFECVLDHVGILRDYSDEIEGVGFGEEREIGGGDFGLGESGSPGDGAESCVGILQVGSCVAFKGRHCVHVERVVVDSVVYISSYKVD